MAKNSKKVSQPVEQTKNEVSVKKSLNDLLLADEMREQVFTLGGEEYQVKIRNHLPAIERALLLDRVEDLYFVNGEYDPEYGALSVRYIIARMYTEESFGDDIDVFERFANETKFELYLPEEAVELIASVADKVAYLVEKHSIPDEQRKMYEAFGLLCTKAEETLSGVMAYLEGAERVLNQDSEVSLGEVVKTLQSLSKQDEKKITAAILDYQAEKAKRRTAVKQTEMK